MHTLVSEVKEKRIHTAVCQFIFPFLIKEGSEETLHQRLFQDGYTFFSLPDQQYESAYYGDKYRISHKNLDKYYLPHVKKSLFPAKHTDIGLKRFSKSLPLNCVHHINDKSIPFRIHSHDVISCPFDIGLLIIRMELAGDDLTYTDALNFIDHFRSLEPQHDRTSLQIIDSKDTFDHTGEFLFTQLTPSIAPFLASGAADDSYFKTLPFFVDERMFVQATFSFCEDEEIDEIDLFRAGHIDGLNEDGRSFVSSSNLAYIKEYCDLQTYKRWSPFTFYVTSEHAYCCLTKQTDKLSCRIINQMYGELFYVLLLHLFQKIALHLFSFRYSRVTLEKDHEKIEGLIRDMTSFSSHFYFPDIVSDTQGREICLHMSNVLGIQNLFDDVNKTMDSLFQYQEKFSDKKNSYLLMILTIYTVISGIFGMNVVIEDLKTDVQWGKMLSYSIFEYIALVVSISGIIIGLSLGTSALLNWLKEKNKYTRRGK